VSIRSIAALVLKASGVGAALWTVACAQAQAQANRVVYPVKPIRLLVGFAPGGGSDLLGRIVGQRLSERLAQSVIIDNRPGANGVIAMDLTAAAPADGYTLLVLSNSSAVSAALLTKVPYNVREAFSPISLIAVQPYVLVTSRTIAASSIKELIAYAKAQKGAVNYGSSGQGSSAHLGMELFKYMAGVEMTHVPYKGIGPAFIDLSSGQVQILFASAVSASTAARGGKVRLLAVGGSRRAEGLPDLPTIHESGLPGFELTGWFGVVGPAGLPKHVVAVLNREIVGILNSPDVRAKLANDGSEAAPTSPDEFKKALLRELATWEKLIKQANLKF
jgi:tripartite-type tricarboxylate transporter receptor subunit TctC